MFYSNSNEHGNSLAINKDDYFNLVDSQINVSLLQLHKKLSVEIDMKIKTLNQFKVSFMEYFKVLEMYILEGKKQLEIFINTKFNNDFNDFFDKENFDVIGK